MIINEGQMRVGEIVAAGILALLSLYLMWESTDLPIGYIAGTGPGGGAWSFWLSAIMLICCVLVFLHVVLGAAQSAVKPVHGADYTRCPDFLFRRCDADHDAHRHAVHRPCF